MHWKSGNIELRIWYVARARALDLVYSNGLTLRIDPSLVPALNDVPRSALAHPYVTRASLPDADRDQARHQPGNADRRRTAVLAEHQPVAPGVVATEV